MYGIFFVFEVVIGGEGMGEVVDVEIGEVFLIVLIIVVFEVGVVF